MTGLAALGGRVCILGPSGSGKSTLAHAIAAARGLPAVHLDQLRHRPRTAWLPRPAAEFAALHAAAVAGERWVIEGNYSDLLPARLARATGVILLDVATPLGLWRYLRRAWFERDRRGALAGAPERVRWAMLRQIVLVQPANRRRYAALFADLACPKLRLATPRALARFYAAEGLRR